MISRLTVLVQAATPQQRAGRTASADDPAEAAMLRRAAALAERLGRCDRAWCSPSRAALDTVAAMRLDATREPALRDLDLGCWTGRALADIAAADPGGLSRWLATGAAGPHGGESFDALLDRVGAWMLAVGRIAGRQLAVAPAMVGRAIIVHCMGGDGGMLRRVDLEPLGTVRLDGRDGTWTLRSVVPDTRPPELT